MDQSEVGIRTLSRLRDMGVRLVLDDFGTGYSSLSYLKHLPLDTIKIDRTFVAGLDGEADRSIVEAVIALAHGLRISVVAEGIETEGQFEILRAMGCDVGQGYLFARPLPAPDAARLLSPGRSGRIDPRRSRRPRVRRRRPAGPARTRGLPVPGRVPSAAPREAAPDSPLAAAAEQAEQEQEQVDEVQVELERADDGRLLHRPGLRPRWRPTGCAGRRRRSGP